MSATTTLVKYPDKSVPEDTLKEFLLNSTAVSLAFGVTAKEKPPRVAIVRTVLSELKNQLAGITAGLNIAKDKQAVLFFDFPEEGFTKESLQPYTLLVNGNDQASCVAFIENVADVEATRAELEELMKEQFDMSKMDIPTLAKRCKEAKTVRLSMKGMLGDNGVITLVFSNGDSAQFAIADGAIQEEDWGAYTVTAGDNEAEETGDQPITPVEDEELTDEQKLERAMSGEDEVEEPVTPKKNGALPPGQHVLTGKPRPQGGSPDVAFQRWTPPPNMRMKDLTKAILARTDKVPPDAWTKYQKGEFFLTVPVEKKAPLKSLQELGSSTAVQPPADDPVSLPERKVAPLPIPEIKGEVADVVKTTFLKDRQIALVDVNSEAIHDPAFLKDVGTSKQPFAQSIGLPNIAATYGWTPEDRKRCIQAAAKKMDPIDFAVNWISWLTFDLIKAQQALQKRGAEPEVQEEVDDVAARRAAAREAAKANRKVA